MSRLGWYKQPRRNTLKDDPRLKAAQEGYKVSRVKPRKRKPKHPGFTTIRSHHLWMFENAKPKGGI